MVTYLQDHNCIPHMAVCKVNPEVGPNQSPTQTPRYRSAETQQVFREVEHVSLGLPGGEGRVIPPQYSRPCHAGSDNVSAASPLLLPLRTLVMSPAFSHARLCWRHHRHPVANGGVHDHIENRGGQGVALRDTSVPLDWASEVPDGVGHHGQAVPVCPKKSNCTGNEPLHCEKV